MHCSAGHGEPDAALPTIVTASIDRVELLRFPLAADVNLVMSGMVTATGRSSMNVDVDFTTSPAAGTPETVLQASATFVARGASGSSTPVPPVVAVSDAEVALFERGRLAMEARRAERAHSLDREPPSGDELGMVHALFLQARSQGRRALICSVSQFWPHPTVLLPLAQGRTAAAAVAGARGGEGRTAAAAVDGARGGEGAARPQRTGADGVCMSETRISTWEITQPQGV